MSSEHNSTPKWKKVLFFIATAIGFIVLLVVLAILVQKIFLSGEPEETGSTPPTEGDEATLRPSKQQALENKTKLASSSILDSSADIISQARPMEASNAKESGFEKRKETDRAALRQGNTLKTTDMKSDNFVDKGSVQPIDEAIFNR